MAPSTGAQQPLWVKPKLHYQQFSIPQHSAVFNATTHFVKDKIGKG